MFGFPRRLWAIHNPLKSWTLAGLNLRECQLLIASMTDAEMKISWAHHQNWPDWRPLGDAECHELFTLKDNDHHIIPPLPEITGDDRDHDITQVRNTTAAPRFREPVPRKFTRYEARIPVDILVGPHCFATHTADVSEGGFLFEDPLPEWVAGYFTVSLNLPETKLEFTCFLAEDQKKEKFRTEIAPTNSDSLIRQFKLWLNEQKFPIRDSPV
jgi:hypothetical protein